MTGTATQAANRIVLARRPAGAPVAADFAIESAPLKELAEGEVLVRTRWISVDPMIALLIGERPLGGAVPSYPVGGPIPGAGIGEVLVSRAADLVPGDLVEGRIGWSDQAVVPAAGLRKVHPGLGAHALSAGGLPGFSAWLGLDMIGDVAGRTVLISGAAGAVGAIVAQLARIRGARTAGFASSAERCAFLEDELGVDVPIDRRSPDIAAQLAALGGIDAYFDNVGGPLLGEVLPHINRQGIVVICGLMNSYTGAPAGPDDSTLLTAIMGRSLRVQGFNNREYLSRLPQFEEEIVTLLRSGQVIDRLNEKAGLQGVIDHMAELFMEGADVGKRIASLD